jgi:DNA-binding MarR family transcriptional regulator
VLSGFDNGPCETWLYSDEKHNIDAVKTMYNAIQKQFEFNGFFSPQELRALKKYAYDPAATSADLAESFKIKKGTVNIYNKRILEKAEKLFERPFANAKETALYLRRMRLV